MAERKGSSKVRKIREAYTGQVVAWNFGPVGIKLSRSTAFSITTVTLTWKYIKIRYLRTMKGFKLCNVATASTPPFGQHAHEGYEIKRSTYGVLKSMGFLMHQRV
jgi:hypothetical protein